MIENSVTIGGDKEKNISSEKCPGFSELLAYSVSVRGDLFSYLKFCEADASLSDNSSEKGM